MCWPWKKISRTLRNRSVYTRTLNCSVYTLIRKCHANTYANGICTTKQYIPSHLGMGHDFLRLHCWKHLNHSQLSSVLSFLNGHWESGALNLWPYPSQYHHHCKTIHLNSLEDYLQDKIKETVTQITLKYFYFSYNINKEH